MLDRLTRSLDFHGSALLLRSERSRVLAGNIANADTPNFKARDFDFRAALSTATGVQLAASGAGSAGSSVPAAVPQSQTVGGHLPAAGGGPLNPPLLYRTPAQTALDANTVDLDMERASFADNTLRYEASLRFINGQIRTLMSAITGQ